MKKSFRFRALTAMLCLMVLASVGLLTIGVAAESTADPTYEQNQVKAEELTVWMFSLTRQYDARAVRQGDATLSRQTNTLILSNYFPQIGQILNKDTQDSTAQDLSEDFALLRAKTDLAAKITWIAFSHGVIELDANGNPVNTEQNIPYDDLLRYRAQIDGITDLKKLSEEFGDSLCVVMNRSVFKQKISALPVELGVPENDTVERVITNAITEIRSCPGYDVSTANPDISREDYLLDGVMFAAIYESARASIQLERYRYDALAEYREIYTLLGQEESILPERLATFELLLRSADNAKTVNDALLRAANSLLDDALPDNGKKYVPAYRASLRAAFDAAANASDLVGVCDLSVFLDGSDTSVAPFAFLRFSPCVIAKDTVFEDVADPILKALIDDYVKTGGILESCQSTDALEFEVARAQLRKALYASFLQYGEQIEQTTPSANAQSLLHALREIYFTADADVLAVLLTAESPEEACAQILLRADTEMADKLRMAEAFRFVAKHVQILEGHDLAEDTARQKLVDAIADFSALHENTKSKLASEQKKLNEKYRDLSIPDIKDGNGTTDYDTADAARALRQSALDKLIGNLFACDATTTPPAAFKAFADECVKRADAVLALLEKYSEILSVSSYPLYADTDKAALFSAIDKALQILTEIPQNPPFDCNTQATVTTTALHLDRLATIAEIALAVNGSTLDAILRTQQDATEAILLATSQEQILSLRASAVFRIGALRQANALKNALNAWEQELLTLDALSAAEASDYAAQTSALRDIIAIIEQYRSPDEQAALETSVLRFEQELGALRASAIAENLASAKQSFFEQIEQLAKKNTDTVLGFVYLSDKERDASKAHIDELVQGFGRQSATANDYDVLRDLFAEVLGRMAEAMAAAEESEEKACRERITKDWDSSFAQPQHYSAEQYALVQKLLDEYRASLSSAIGIDGMLRVRDEANARLSAVPTVLDDAKEAAKAQLEEVFEKLSKNRTRYSESTWSNIEEIYANALSIIQNESDISKTDYVSNIAKEKGELLQNARCDILYSVENGLWGSLSSPGNIPLDATFGATTFDPSQAQDAYQSAIQKEKVIGSDGHAVDNSVLSRLRRSELLTGICLTYSESATGPCRITLQLASDLIGENIWGVVFVREDGCVEFYHCEVEEGLISFDISHFSDYYIVSEKPTSLWFLIILLSVILALEAIAIGVLLLRRWRKRRTQNVMALLPLTPLAMTQRIVPDGAPAALIILGLLNIIGALILFMLIREEIVTQGRQSPCEQEPLSTPICEPAPPPPAQAEVLTEEITEEPELKPAPLSSVSVAEANERISDREAKSQMETREAPLHYPTGKKFEINIDVISSHFEKGETVCLETLKERGLIPKSTQAIKILARGSLDKPLCVLAHDFSVAAVKMILLTGGEAILIERKPAPSKK